MTSDPFFKSFFVNRLIQHTQTTRHSIKVGELPLEIDLVFEIDPLNHSLQEVLGSFSEYASKYNIVEFKGPGDKFLRQTIHKLRGYMGFYWEAENLPLTVDQESIGWIISSSTPKWIKNELTIARPRIDLPGYYRFSSGTGTAINLILINELPIQKEYYPFLLFSKGKKLKEFIKQVYKENDELYKGSCFIINYKVVKEMSETDELVIHDYGSNIRAALKSLGLKNVVDQIGLKDLIEEIGMHSIIEEVGLKQVIDEISLKQVIDEISLKQVIDEIGLKQVIDEIGLKQVIDEIGHRELTPEDKEQLKKLLE